MLTFFLYIVPIIIWWILITNNKERYILDSLDVLFAIVAGLVPILNIVLIYCIWSDLKEERDE